MSQTHKALRGGGTVSDRSFVENSAYVSASATVDENSYLGHGSFIGTNTTIGKRVLICNLVRVGNNVVVGDGVTIECGNVIPDGTVIPPGATLLDPCCSVPPIPPEGAMLNFDSINAVGTRLAVFDTTGLTKGTLCYVGNDSFAGKHSVQDYFSLRYGEGLTPDGLTIVNSTTFGVDGAQWVRQNVINQDYINRPFWAIDPQNVSTLASDENTGHGTSIADASLAPLVSMQELNRRLLGYKDTPITIQFLSAPDINTWTPLLNLSSDSGTQEYVTILGTLTPIDVAGTNVIITAHTDGDHTTGGGGTERTITIAGLGLKPQYVGKPVHKTDGSIFAVVTRQTAPDVFSISEPVAGDLTVWTPLTNFADGDHVTFYDVTPMPGYPLGPNTPKYPLIAYFRFDAAAVGPGIFPLNQTGTAVPQITSCIFGSDSSPSDCHFIGGLAGQQDCPWMVACAIRKRRVVLSGSWNLASCATCLGQGTNGGDGPRLAGATLFINGELTMTGTGHNFYTNDGGLTTIAPMGSASLATWGLEGWAFNMSGDSLATGTGDGHSPGIGFFQAQKAPFIWYGDCPLINPDTGSLHTLFQFGQGINRIKFDPTRIVVTIGGTQLRVKLIDANVPLAGGVFMDFVDCPISNLDGAYLGD